MLISKLACAASLPVGLIPAVLAQLYPAEPLETAYSDLPAVCTDICASFQDVFLPCSALSDGSIILSPDSSHELLADCVCKDQIKDGLSACYSCNKDNAPAYRLGSTSLTTIAATALNYDRLCGTSVWQDPPATNHSSSAEGTSIPSASTPSLVTFVGTTASSSSRSSSSSSDDVATPSLPADTTSVSPTMGQGGNSSTRLATPSFTFFVAMIVLCML
ncbi:hypothetical protein JCM11251_001250 [Rhodosporidiobolus azoricus]